MKVFNIHFRFRDVKRVAHVLMSEATDHFTIYFTDVELILEFGNKAKYNQQDGVSFLKASKDSETLKKIISSTLQEGLDIT